MPIIQRLEASKHVKGRVLVYFEDVDLIKLTEEEVLLHQLYAGKELSPVAYEALLQEAQWASAKATAARICAARMISCGELLQKLREKGISPAHAQRAVDWLQELGVISDRNYAAAIVRHYAGRGYGRRRIESEFIRRKIPREEWAEALDTLDEQGTSTDDMLQRLLRRKLCNCAEIDEKTLAKTQNFLLRRGFDWEQVRSALEQYRTDER